jgi:hypothetical protein
MGVTGAPDGWTPVRLEPRADGHVIAWCYTDGYEFDDPFFEETIQRCLREPARLLFRRATPLTAIAEPEAPQPSGLIAHMSRCGSTMLSQALVARGDVLVWSEPPIVDQVVRAAAVGHTTVDSLRGVLAIPARAGRPHSVVKLDAWTTLDLPIVRAAAPDVPIVMLVRDPLEVFVSHQGHRGFHMIPGTLPAEVLGIPPGLQLDPDEYGARVLGRILERAHESLAGDDRAMIVDYRELPDALSHITAFLGMDTSEPQRQAMAVTLTRNAKNPVLPFVADGETKRESAAPHMRDAVDEWARPWYELLLQTCARLP